MTAKKMDRQLREMAAEARGRLMNRPVTPDLRVTDDAGRLCVESPYGPDDLDNWEALLFDGFATRSGAVMSAFLRQLGKLLPDYWDAKEETRKPDPDELRAAIQIVKSLGPRNEAEACIAAQAVALNIANMKLAEQTCSGWGADVRSVAVLAKATKTFAGLVETMDRLKGKRRTTRQKIIVKQVREVHHHEHKHIHYEGGGSDFGGRPLASPEAGRTPETLIRACEPAERASLPSSEEAGRVLPFACGEGEARLSDARGRQRIGRTAREG